MKKSKFKDKVCYTCEVCGFAYYDKSLAEECEEWCSEHHSCSMEITKKAINLNRK